MNCVYVFNANKSSLGVLIDLSKAFYAVNHEIILTKLKHSEIKIYHLK